MRIRITKQVVDRARAVGRELKVWDTEVPGFGLRVRLSGGRVYFVAYGSGRRGRGRRVTIGRHGAPWTPDQAREEARRLLGAVAKGEDPAVARAHRRGLPTLSELGTRWLAEQVEPHKRPRTAAEYRRIVTRVLSPRLGQLRIDQLQHADVAAFHHARRSTPTEANRAVAVLSSLLSWAERVGLRARGTNPAHGLPRFPETKRERFLSDAELARLGAALAEADAGEVGALSFADEAKAREAGELRPDQAAPVVVVDPYAVALARLLLFTGARLTEILAAVWANVDPGSATLRVPLPKEGRPKLLRLGPPALEVLAGLPRLEGNPHVIVGRVAGRHLVDAERPWRRIRTRAGLEDVHLHDLRHSFASVAVAGGASLPLIGGLLGHRQPATTARYAHLSDDPLAALAERTSERIASALRAGTQPSAQAVEILKRRRRA